ncbi:MAG: hypothetical protein ABIF87_07545 [Pseudomonadota bacterium]
MNYKRFMELLCLASKNKLAADPRRQPQTFCSADLTEQKMHSLREIECLARRAYSFSLARSAREKVCVSLRASAAETDLKKTKEKSHEHFRR